MQRPRWSVCEAFDANGWHDPVIETDDPREVERVYEERWQAHRGERWYTVAIFDDQMGDGHPTGPETMWERVERAREEVVAEAALSDFRFRPADDAP